MQFLPEEDTKVHPEDIAPFPEFSKTIGIVGDQDSELRMLASALLPTHWGTFRIYGFQLEATHRDTPKEETALALLMGTMEGPPPLVRIHSECLTGDVFGSCRCDCGEQLHAAMEKVAKDQRGMVIYEKQEGRGIGLMWKLRAYKLQEQGLDTLEANEKLGFKPDYRQYHLPARILSYFGVRQVRLLSNNPDKIQALENYGIEVVERVPCEVSPSGPYARRYLLTKKNQLGHLLSVV
jgi:GTP cyclohydrolase II